MTDAPSPRVIAELQASAWRQAMSVVIAAALGATLLYLAVVGFGRAPVATLVMGVAGVACLWQAHWMRHRVGGSILLTTEGLEDSTGEVLAPWANIAEVDRGFFAFKPSNGFLIKLKSPMPRAWAPGLWWRMGRKVGVGGATSGFAARQLADRITVLLMDQEARKAAGIHTPTENS